MRDASGRHKPWTFPSLWSGPHLSECHRAPRHRAGRERESHVPPSRFRVSRAGARHHQILSQAGPASRLAMGSAGTVHHQAQQASCGSSGIEGAES